MKAVSESLAGRAVHLHLGPITWSEMAGRSELPRIVRLVKGEHPSDVFRCLEGRVVANPCEENWVTGGLPPAILRKSAEARRIWFTGYEQTYLDRDLRDLTHVADIGLFGQFLRLTALRTAQVLNAHDLARDCGSNPVTVSRWISVLEAGFLVRRLPPFFSNRAKRLVKAPKVYFADSGLASFLCGVHSAAALEGHALRGAIAETYVCQNLGAMLAAHVPEANLLHYRTHSGEEVDFVIEAGSSLVAMEMKASSRVDARDLKGLGTLLKGDPRCKVGLVLYTGAEVKNLGGNIWAIPLALGLS
jgi:predicted AAA+ superfamily ATPase